MGEPAIDLSAGMRLLNPSAPPSGIDLSAGMVSKPASALSRFASNAASGAGVMPEEDAENFFKHPIDTAGRMLNAQGELGARAGREIKSGDLVRGLTHGAEWLLPGIGPTLAKSGDQLESGDIAGGAGTAVGAAVPLAVGSPEARAAAGTTVDAVRSIPAGKIAQSIGNAAAPAIRATGKVLNNPAAAPAVGAAVDLATGGHGLSGAIAGHLARSGLRGAFDRMSNFGIEEPTYPGAPLPETPPTELSQAAALFRGASSPPDPAAGLWTIKQPGQAGQLVESVQKPSAEVAPGVNRGSLQDLLDKSLGAKKLDPKVPLRQQMPATSGTSVSTAPADAAVSSPSAEPEHIGQFARANGLELHQAIPATVEGDVLRAKIHDMSNVQVRQLAINSGVDMGQKPVTNAKNAGGVTRQQALKWIMMNHTPEEIGDMIDQGQHLPGPPSGAISGALARSGDLK